MLDELSDVAKQTLTSAGWHPERSLEQELRIWGDTLVRNGRFELFPSARDALCRFGGLAIDVRGPGIDRAREPFVLDPTRAIDAECLFQQYSKLLKTRLFPLGESGDQAFIAIADTGKVYLLFEGSLLIGDSIERALSNLIEGRGVPEATWLV